MNPKFNIKNGRLPNLGTILMVEDVIKKQKTTTIPKIKNSLKKQVMHQTLKIILTYLWESKKIEYTPRGIEWIFKER